MRRTLIALAALLVAGSQVVGEGMTEIGHYRIQNMDEWSAKTPSVGADGSFHLYANDIARGLDVHSFDGRARQSAKTGTWMGPAEAASYLGRLPKADVTKRNALVCLLPQP